MIIYKEDEGGYVSPSAPVYITDNMENPSYRYDHLWYKKDSFYFTVSAQRTLYDPSDPATSPVTHGKYTLNTPEFSINGNIMNITPYYGDDGEEADNYYVWFVNADTNEVPEPLSGFRLYGEHTVDLQELFDDNNTSGSIPYGNYKIYIVAHKYIYGWEVEISTTSEMIVWNYSDKHFDDVNDPSRYYYEPVYWAAAKGITLGTSDTKFSPDGTCTRAMIVTFLWRLMGSPEPSSYPEKLFVDVNDETRYFYKAVYWALENGITTGLNDGTGRFGPDMPCTREQVVTFLWRTAGKPPVTGDPEKFTDVKDSTRYFYDAVYWAAEKGITVGLNDGTGRFGVGTTCTRAMIVTFLFRYDKNVH